MPLTSLLGSQICPPYVDRRGIEAAAHCEKKSRSILQLPVACIYHDPGALGYVVDFSTRAPAPRIEGN